MAIPTPPVIPQKALWPLELISNLPFGSTTDLAAIDDLHPDRLREHLRVLHDLGLVDCRFFGTPVLRSEKRWWCTTHGYNALLQNAAADDEIATIRESWAGLGVSARRPDVAAVTTRVVKRLVSGILDRAPVFVVHFGAGPLDCLVELSGNRLIGVIHAGPALRRSSVWNRLKGLKEMPIASQYSVLILAPTVFDRNAFLDQMRSLGLSGAVATVDAAVNSTNSCWLVPGEDGWFGYKDIAANHVRSLVFRKDQSPVTSDDLELPLTEGRTTPVRGIETSPALHMPPSAKRFLQLLGDWVMLPREDALGILGVSSSQFSNIMRPLKTAGLVSTVEWEGKTAYAQSDAGISYASARDRSDPGAMLDLLSVSHRHQIPDGATRKQMIAARRGKLARWSLTNFQHNTVVTETVGNLTRELRDHSDWRVNEIIPPKRGRIAITPGSNVGRLRAALLGWRVRSTKRPTVAETKDLVIYPDALTFVQAAGGVLRLLLEVELTARTPKALQDRLENHVLHSVVRPDDTFTLFVFGSPESEAKALAAQTRWVQADPRRRWPTATTTVELIRTNFVTSRIWQVSANANERHSILDLPELVNRR